MIELYSGLALAVVIVLIFVGFVAVEFFKGR